MTGVSRDPGTSANFRYTTSTDMTACPAFAASLPPPLRRCYVIQHGRWGERLGFRERATH